MKAGPASSQNGMTEEQLEMTAAANAVSCWFNWEGTLSLQIQQHPFSNAEQFRMWLSQWGLARRVKLKPASRTSRLQEFLDFTARPFFLGVANANEEAFNHVITLTNLAVETGKTECRELSMLSKYAFSCNPRIFVPYDKRARDALREVWWHKFKDGDYIAYMSAFDAAKVEVVSRLASIGVTSDTFSISGRKLDKVLFELRVTDKRLMLAGGFSAGTMLKDCRKLDQNLEAMLRRK